MIRLTHAVTFVHKNYVFIYCSSYMFLLLQILFRKAENLMKGDLPSELGTLKQLEHLDFSKCIHDFTLFKM